MNLKKWLLKLINESIGKSEISDTIPNQDVIDNIINKTINKKQNKNERDNFEMAQCGVESTQLSQVSNPIPQEPEGGNTAGGESKPGDGNDGRNDGGNISYGVKRQIVAGILAIREYIDKEKKDAYKEGVAAGRNAKIEEEYFPTVDDGIPSFRDAKPKSKPNNSIFTIARESR